MRTAALILIGLSLAGCRIMPAKEEELPAPTGTVEGEAGDVARPAGTSGAFSRTGDWAASASQCQGGVWHFRQGKVATDGATSCDIRSSTPVTPEQTVLQMACTADGVATSERWTLTREEDGRMRVQRVAGDGGSVSDIVLQRCG